MSECITIALIGALINMILALFIPCLLKNTKQPMLENIKKVYATHKQVIFTSSAIVFITIYLAIKITPQLDFSFGNKLSLNPTYEEPTNSISSLLNTIGSQDRNNFRFINLSKL
jgi:hypothetical protein